MRASWKSRRPATRSRCTSRTNSAVLSGSSWRSRESRIRTRSGGEAICYTCAVTVRTRTTLAEFLGLPETKPYLELMDGEVIEKPMPGRKHGTLVAYLLKILGNYLDVSNE